jgi:GH25 family lysozyme M1 (1,4-beta-N-acetylmuramidase)
MAIDGIDVSHHQGAIDWRKVASGGKQFAIIRCSFGTIEDEMFEGYRKGAKSNKLVVAAYCFGRSDEEAVDQADAALEIAGEGAGIFLDIEPWKDRSGKTVPKMGVPAAEAFAKRVDRKGRYLGTYTSSGVFGAAKSDILARFPLWVAHYGVTRPTLPPNWKRWAIWQHSSKGSGKQLGAASAFLDLDRYQGSLASLQEWFSGKIDKADQSNDVDTAGSHDGVEANRFREDPTPPWPGQNFTFPSPHVRRWQRQMRRLRFDLAVDGLYGAESERACLEFQRQHGLDTDGIVGPKTWEATFRKDG